MLSLFLLKLSKKKSKFTRMEQPKIHPAVELYTYAQHCLQQLNHIYILKYPLIHIPECTVNVNHACDPMALWDHHFPSVAQPTTPIQNISGILQTNSKNKSIFLESTFNCCCWFPNLLLLITLLVKRFYTKIAKIFYLNKAFLNVTFCTTLLAPPSHLPFYHS